MKRHKTDRMRLADLEPAACERTSRDGRGMEIAPKYCAVILERMTKLNCTARLVEDKPNQKPRKKTAAISQA